MDIEKVDKTVYKTSDGVEFENREHAVLHQAMIDEGATIDAFIETMDNTECFKGSMRRVLIQYSQYKAKSGMEDNDGE